ncbi:multiprotein-bridging factor 1 family protein [Nonomuraea typhae]|uniref:Multiprotein-bridging factor 1 family protein n=1 Tax=Nonomuraea typhae TaxID=2603600 RepID=A0ABW7ZCN2_9ACTN
MARRLKAAMTERGLTHRDLAELADLGHRTVGRILLGDGYPDLATMARLEQAIDVELYPSRWHRHPRA